MEKIFRKVLIVFSAILLSFSVYADDNTVKPVQSTILIKGVKSTNQPRSLPLLYMECNYCQGYISLEIPSDIEAVEVAIEDYSMVVWSGVLTPDFPESDIPYLSGEFLITCTTDAGDVYQGILVF